ncbi:MAG: DUF1559 domain-containing protein [Phycisphaerae bacterium]
MAQSIRESGKATIAVHSACSARPAFTLIEMLVVVAIIVLLAAILIPSALGAREAARATACLSNLKQMGHAVQMYTQDNRSILPGPTNPLLFRSGLNLSGLGQQGIEWARYNLPYKLARYLGSPEQGPAAFDAVSTCPSADGVPLLGVYAGLPASLGRQRCYYVANTGGIEHGINRRSFRPWYATNPVNYFGYLRYGDRPDLWPEYEKTRRMPKSILNIRNQSSEWVIADLWHWEAGPPRGALQNVGTWPFPVGTVSAPSFCGGAAYYYVPCQPFHNTNRRFSPSGSDRNIGSPRLLTGRTNAVYLDGHADPVRDWKGTVNPCFRFDIYTGTCVEGL